MRIIKIQVNKEENEQYLTLFLFISAAIHKMKEIKPREREIIMKKKITEYLHLGGGFSMMEFLSLNEEAYEKSRRNNNEYVLKLTQGTKL